MAAANGSAAPSSEAVADQPRQAEAAVEETTEERKSITWKPKEDAEEITLDLPPKLLGSVIFRAGILRDDDVVGSSRLSQAVLGGEQFDRVMDAMDAAGVTTDDEEGMTSLGNLLNSALAMYGLTEGESTASQES